MKKCITRKLYISKNWAKVVFNTFSFDAKMREKNGNYRTDFWNFGLFTKLPLTVSSTSVFLHRAHGGAVRRRGHLSRPLGLTLAKPAPSAPCFTNPLLPGATRARHAPSPPLRSPRRLPSPAELPLPCAPPQHPSSPASSPPDWPSPPPFPI